MSRLYEKFTTASVRLSDAAVPKMIMLLSAILTLFALAAGRLLVVQRGDGLPTLSVIAGRVAILAAAFLSAMTAWRVRSGPPPDTVGRIGPDPAVGDPRHAAAAAAQFRVALAA